jgi:hypothetical protein
MSRIGTSGVTACERGTTRALHRAHAGALRGLLTVGVGLLALAGSVTVAQAAETVTRTYSSAGEATFVVPAGVESIQVLAIGGAGGSVEHAKGGRGASVSGALSVTPGSTLYVEVGSNGGSSKHNAGAGGGSSDVRTLPRADGLAVDGRLIVAGAGGGGGRAGAAAGNGGNAGGEEGQRGGRGDDSSAGEGGSQEQGGEAGEETGPAGRGEQECVEDPEAEFGELETGGRGGYCAVTGAEGGGGGAGYYGGGGGAAGDAGAGGGGGSSLVPAGGSVSVAETEGPQVQISYAQPVNPPAVVTGSASGVTPTSETLNATVDPEDEEVTSCTFEYGPLETYGQDLPCSTAPGSGITPVAVSAAVSDLSSGTYHYRIVAANANGTSHGGDATFTTIAHEQPTVTGVSPEAGALAGGTSVTLTGTELEEATAVSFGARSAASFQVNSARSITAVAPAGTKAGTVAVHVTTPSGTSNAGEFTYVSGYSLSWVAPADGPTSGGTTVEVIGEGFDRESTVSFGAIPAGAVTYGSSRSITVVSPAGIGTEAVTVSTPGLGTTTFSRDSYFGYESGAPEFGRCVSRLLGGDFSTKTCSDATAAEHGDYVWYPGVEKPAFKGSSGAVTLETTGKVKLTCSAATLVGETAPPAGMTGVTIRLTGCESNAKACTTAGLQSGEIQTSTLEAALGWESKSTADVALDLYPDGHSGSFMQYACNGAGATSVTGSLLIPLKVGKMGASLPVKVKAKKGRQKLESLEGGAPDVLSLSTGGATPEQAGLTLTATLDYEEALEINPAA